VGGKGWRVYSSSTQSSVRGVSLKLPDNYHLTIFFPPSFSGEAREDIIDGELAWVFVIVLISYYGLAYLFLVFARKA